MDNYEFIAELVGALAWPLITLVIVVLIRPIIAKMNWKIKWGDLEVELSKNMNHLAARIEVEIPNVEGATKIQSEKDEISTVHSRNVSTSVHKGLSRLQRGANALAVRRKLEKPQMVSPYLIAKNLVDKGIDKNDCELFWKMLVLGNELTRADKEVVGPDVAKTFLLSAIRIEEYLDSIGTE